MKNILNIFRKKMNPGTSEDTIKRGATSDGHTFINTMEGWLLHGSEVYYPVRRVFNELPSKYRRALAFSPNKGGCVERMNFWKEALKAAELSERQYHTTLRTLLEWYIHINRL